MFTTEVNNWEEITKQLELAGELTKENVENIMKTIVPQNPIISYYNGKDELLYQSNKEQDFYAFQLMAMQRRLKDFYCTIETEWWDENDEFQGPGSVRDYKKFYFNGDGQGAMEDWYQPTFESPYNFLIEMNRTRNNYKPF